MIPDDIQITTELLLWGILIFAVVDGIFVPVLVRIIRPSIFRNIKWTQVGVAGIIWFAIWRWALVNFWGAVYIHVFPAWGQYWLPPLFSFLMAIVALGLWTLALRLRMHPVVGYTLLGGVWGVCTHIWAVNRGVVEKPPLLQGASPVAAVAIAFFEYMFYWCVILALSAFIYRGWHSLQNKKD